MGAAAGTRGTGAWQSDLLGNQTPRSGSWLSHSVLSRPHQPPRRRLRVAGAVRHRWGEPGHRRPFWTQVGGKRMCPGWERNPCCPTPTHQHVTQETRVPLLRLLSTPAPQRKDTHLPPCSCRDLCSSCTCSPRPHFLGSAHQGHTPGFPGVSEQSPTTFASPDVSAKLTPCNLLSPLPHVCKNSKDEARPTRVLRLSPRTARVCSSPWPGGTRPLSNLKRLSCPCVAEIITWSLTR